MTDLPQQDTVVSQLCGADYQIIKENYTYYKSKCKSMIKALIKSCPKDILIEVLKEGKIIQRDWCAKGEKFKEKER